MKPDDVAWYENPELKNLFIKAASNAMRGYHAPITSPKTTFTGTNSLLDFTNHLGAFLDDDERRVLIIVDKDLQHFADRVANLLKKKKNIDCRIFNEVYPDVPKNSVLKGVKICQEFDPKVIIALGGGSAMDTAKLVFLLYEKPDINLNTLMAPSYVGLRKKVYWLVAIPTTSGTGAETTFIAVIKDTDRDPPKKTEVVLYELCPDFAVLVPDFVKTMPPYLTMGTGMDALAHSMGSYMLTMSTEFTDMCMLKAIEMIIKYLPRSVKWSDDMEARERMQLAAYISGLGFGNVSGGIEHALGHALGAVFEIHHGVCVGIFLPASIAYQSKVTNRFFKLAELFGVSLENNARDEILKSLLLELLNFMRTIGCPTNIKELDRPRIERDDYFSKIDQLTEFAFNDYCTLSSSRRIQRPEYKKIFEIMYDGKLEDIMGLYHM
ncbi:MAG: iron-containing alcohol dehydrogenase [Promethearchaeota archaeon]